MASNNPIYIYIYSNILICVYIAFIAVTRSRQGFGMIWPNKSTRDGVTHNVPMHSALVSDVRALIIQNGEREAT